MSSVLFKVKSIAILAVLAAIGGAATYLTTDVDFVESFGPTWGAVAATIVAYLVKDKLPLVNAYLERLVHQRPRPPAA